MTTRKKTASAGEADKFALLRADHGRAQLARPATLSLADVERMLAEAREAGRREAAAEARAAAETPAAKRSPYGLGASGRTVTFTLYSTTGQRLAHGWVIANPASFKAFRKIAEGAEGWYEGLGAGERAKLLSESQERAARFKSRKDGGEQTPETE